MSIIIILYGIFLLLAMGSFFIWNTILLVEGKELVNLKYPLIVMSIGLMVFMGLIYSGVHKWKITH